MFVCVVHHVASEREIIRPGFTQRERGREGRNVFKNIQTTNLREGSSHLLTVPPTQWFSNWGLGPPGGAHGAKSHSRGAWLTRRKILGGTEVSEYDL